MSLDRSEPTEFQTPVESRDQLVAYFRSGEKPPQNWKVGIEHEKIGLFAEDLSPVPHEGRHGIGALLETLAREDGWTPIREGDKTIALQKDDTAITLEPGGQFELAGKPLGSLFESRDEIERHLAMLRRLSEPHGIVWLALGLHPFHGVDDLPRMPRVRHDIMRDCLPKRGALAMEMMHATATVQANLDYADESDFAAKIRTAMGVTPIVSAIYANSSISAGKANGFISRRVHIWRHTDPDRTGLLPFVFEPDFGYERWVRWALEVPMFFIVRGGRYHPTHGQTFASFLELGQDGERAIVADFDRHLTTLFPEVRAKRFIEVRGADAVPLGLTLALPALWKGLLYDAEARSAAFDQVAAWSFPEREALLEEVARRGLRATAPDGRPILEIARALTAIADQGLRGIARRAASECDESAFLDPVREQLELGCSPGEIVRDRWEGEWGRSPRRLARYARY